jgi:hypothetical protein
VRRARVAANPRTGIPEGSKLNGKKIKKKEKEKEKK